MRARAIVWLLAVVGSGGCYAGAGRAFSPQTFEREHGWTAITSVPVQRQQSERDCGAAVALMVLGYWGIPATEAEVRAATGLAPDRGLRADHLRAYLRARGLEAFLFEGTFGDFEHELTGGRPVVVGVVKRVGETSYAHYQIIVGMNRAREQVVVIDPADGWRVYSFAGFAREWKPTRFLTMAVSPGEAAEEPN